MAGSESILSRVLGVVFGVLIIVTGVYAFVTPLETYGIVSWLIAFAMIADGIGKIMLWNDERRLGVSDVWALVGGILSVVLGIGLAGSRVAMATVDLLVAYLVGGWVLASGIVRIVRFFAMRNIHVTYDTQILGANWDLALIMGILMVILGIFCLVNPLVVMVGIGYQIGFALVMSGISLVTATL